MKCAPPSPQVIDKAIRQPEQGEVCFFVFFEAIYPRSNMAGVYTAVAEIGAPVLGKGGVWGGGGRGGGVGPFLMPVLPPGCS